MAARKRQTNISLSLAVDLFAEVKAPTEIKEGLSTDFIQSHPSPCICVKQSFPSYAGEKVRMGRINIKKEVRFCSQSHLYNPAKVVNVTWSVTCLAKDRICLSSLQDKEGLQSSLGFLHFAYFYSIVQPIGSIICFQSWFSQPWLTRFKDKPNFTGVIKWFFHRPLPNSNCYCGKKRVNLIKKKFRQNIIILCQSSSVFSDSCEKLRSAQVWVSLRFSYQSVENWPCIKQQQEVYRLILESSQFVSVILVDSVSYPLSHAYHRREAK